MKSAVYFILAVFAFAIAVALTGCETESASSEISVSPDSVTIKKGEAIEFTASGGYEYSWSLQNDSLGVLSQRKGNKTTYTSLIAPGTNSVTVQILTVTSTISTSGGTSTNVLLPVSASSQAQAQAHITHVE